MDFDVIIVGGGLVGASLALALGKAGIRTAVVEARPPCDHDVDGWDSRIYAISPGSAAFLDDCGAWGGLDAERICQVEEMHIFGDNAHSHLDFSAYDAGLRELAFIAENRALQRALWQAMQAQHGIELLVPAACRALTLAPEAAQLELADGRALSARLVVGADGADSWVRAQAGVAVEVRPYRQMGVVANFSATRAHHDAAFQWFRRDGVLAMLPLPGNRASMVWSTPDEHARQLLALAPEELGACVAEAVAGMLGELRVITPAAGFPLRLQRVARLVLPRLALVGDAAHNVHPLAGQGVNLGFRDARELARVLIRRGACNDCGDYFLLRRYERARQEDIAAMRFTTDTLQKMFDSANPWLTGMRNLGLHLTNSVPHLKNLLVRQAVG